MWEKAAAFFYIWFWKFLKKGKIKDKQQPLEFTDHRSAVIFLLSRGHEGYCFHFLNRIAFLFCPFVSRDSFTAILDLLHKASHCSSGAALPVADLDDPSLKGRAGLIFLQVRGGRRMRKRKDTEVFKWDYQYLSVFLTFLNSSSSWVTAEPVPGLPGQHIPDL